ncbi:unnamed protein product [Prunus armeniaca]|uniref:Tf2-1-like SH3-like domain-containing protein n=1 Tax=Prunus armeniaca TaxID=36596 RepID=A0A6J5XH85_PRUAR|nr:unnamed protein product [Prunus armeniaca]
MGSKVEPNRICFQSLSIGALANSLKRLEDANAKYKQVADVKSRHVEFEVGDFLWAILTKYRFPAGEYKLVARKISLVEIVAKMNLNAYPLKLPSHLCTADVFNVKHHFPYHGDSSNNEDLNSGFDRRKMRN